MATEERKRSQAVAVSGLAPGVTESLLMNMLRTYGPILRIAMNGSGGAHVVFERKGNAFKAASATNGALLNGKPIAVTLVRDFKKTMRPCRGFQAGKCRQGDECKYLHVTDTTVDTSAAQAAVAAKAAAKKPIAIPTIVSATAKRAAAASAAAPREQKKPTTTAATATAAKPRAARPCLFFAAGLCKRGSECAFNHDAPVVAAPLVKAQTEKAPPATVTVPTAVATDVDTSRTCIECEEVGSAQWQCSKCDDALYCDACNALVHKSKVMQTHARVALAPLPVVAANPPCDECEECESSVKCAQCDVVLCASCDASVHRFKSLRSHVRAAIASTTVTAATPIAAAPQPVAAKRAIPVAVVAEPAPKKQKVVAATPVATKAAAVPEISYVESVPRYDLTSESESDSEEDGDDEDEQPQQVTTVEPMDVDSGSSDESDDDDDDDEPPAIASALPTRSVVPMRSAPVAAAPTGDISSESSDDDEDERPVVLAAPVRKVVAAPKPIVAAAASESSDSSDDEDEKPRVASAPAPVVSRPVAADDSSSDSSSSSDDEDEKPRAPAPKAKAPTPTPVQARTPAKRAAAPTAARSNSANPGISTGSSHSLVKKIEAYADSGSAETLHLDANLNGFERLLAHDCAERLGLAHVSVGEGLERHITISRTR